MTIGVTIPENDGATPTVATGGETSIPFDFPIFEATDIKVYETAADGTLTLLTKDTDYAVPSGSLNQQAGGNITLDATQYPSGATATHKFTVVLDPPQQRITDFNEAGDLFANSLNKELDKIVQMIQRIGRQLSLSPRLNDDSDISTITMDDPEPGKVLAWDATGTKIINQSNDATADTVTATGSTTERTMADRFGEIANILDFGGLPYTDGGTSAGDSSDALTAALATGKPVYLPAIKGQKTVYDIKDIDIPDGAVIRGEGGVSYASQIDTKVILRKRTGAAYGLNLSNTSGWHFSNFLLDGVDKSVAMMDLVTADGYRGRMDGVIVRQSNNGYGDGTRYWHGSRLNYCVFTENGGHGIANLVDSYVGHTQVAASDSQGIQCASGSNDTNYINCKVEFNLGHGYSFFSCQNITIVGGVIDRNYKVGTRFAGTANNISVTGTIYRRNGRNGVSGENAHISFDGSSVTGINIANIQTKTGADDDGSGPDTPAYAVAVVSGDPSFKVEGNLSGCITDVLTGTFPDATAQIVDTSGTYSEESNGLSINRRDGEQFIVRKAASVANKDSDDIVLDNMDALADYSTRYREVIITSRQQSATDRQFCKLGIVFGKETGAATVEGIEILQQGGTNNSFFSTALNALDYDAQTGNFTTTDTLTGGSSGATATIDADADGGTTGTLTLSGISGNFSDNETITDATTGSATSNGTLYYKDGTHLAVTVNSTGTQLTLAVINGSGQQQHYVARMA